MLQFADSPYRYFPPKPNRFIAWIAEWVNRRHYLPGPIHRIENIVVENTRPLMAAMRSHGRRVMFLPNHSTHSDPQILVEVLRQVGVRSLFMAAYDVFERSARDAWFMQRLGAFSVDRDGSDRQSMKEALRTVAEGRHALTIFPEGNVYFMNDRVTPFLDGPAFIAVKAQQELKGNGNVLAVPVSIKATHVTDCRATLRKMLAEMAAALGVELDDEAEVVANIHRVGIAMVQRNLKMRGFMPPDPDFSDLPALLRAAAGLILERLEAKMEVTPKAAADLMDRIRAARREIHKVRSDPEREIDHAVAASWADEAILAFRILSYAGDYLSEKPTLDRVGETIEKMREDLYSRAFPAYAERTVRVRMGEPMEVSAAMAGTAKPREAMAGLTEAMEQAVQSGLDELNADNTSAGAELF